MEPLSNWRISVSLQLRTPTKALVAAHADSMLAAYYHFNAVFRWGPHPIETKEDHQFNWPHFSSKGFQITTQPG